MLKKLKLYAKSIINVNNANNICLYSKTPRKEIKKDLKMYFSRSLNNKGKVFIIEKEIEAYKADNQKKYAILMSRYFEHNTLEETAELINFHVNTVKKIENEILNDIYIEYLRKLKKSV